MRTEVALSCSLKDTAFHHHCFKQTMDILACILHRKAQNNKLQYVYSQIRGRGEAGRGMGDYVIFPSDYQTVSIITNIEL